MATVAFGLVAAATWGSGDFAGGMLVRRTPVLGVVLVSQLVGTVIALVLALVRGETMPLSTDIPWSVAGGLSGGIGIVALYRGLAVGRMGVVAPVTGVIAAAIPVLFGVLIEGLPTALVAIGIGLAIIAVILVSRVDDGRAGPSGLGLALVAGTLASPWASARSPASQRGRPRVPASEASGPFPIWCHAQYSKSVATATAPCEPSIFPRSLMSPVTGTSRPVLASTSRSRPGPARLREGIKRPMSIPILWA